MWPADPQRLGPYALRRRLRLHSPTEWIQFWSAHRDGAPAGTSCIVAALSDRLTGVESVVRAFEADVADIAADARPSVLRAHATDRAGSVPFVEFEPFPGATLEAIWRAHGLHRPMPPALSALLVARLAAALHALDTSPPGAPTPIRLQPDTVLFSADGAVRLVPPLPRTARAEEPSYPGIIRLIDLWTLSASPDDLTPRAHVHRLGNLLRALTPDAPLFDDLVRRCTDPDPTRRYAGPGALASALQHLEPAIEPPAGTYRANAHPQAAAQALLARLVADDL